MKLTLRFALASLCFGVLLAIVPAAAAQELALSPHASLPSGVVDFPLDKKYEDFNKLIAGAHQYEGLFKLHLKEDRLYAEIQPHQFDRPLLCPIAVARGMALGGYTLNFDEQWVLLFHRVGDKVHLIRRNVHYQARGGPVARAVETTYTDSVLMALRIVTINPMKQSVVINLNDIFMTDFAQLGIGHFDSSRSIWHKVKAFPKNIELEVAATYSGGRGRFADESVIDPRGNTVILHYGLAELPQSGYQPRLADDRVGYFLSVVKDFSSDSKDTTFLRHVNRWRLERAETHGSAKLAPPKKKIVYWIEKSVPDEYRAYVREGILEWNKAFEKIGFRDAIEVRQQESEDFDPEDITYSTFRWITTDQGFAMGPSRANPLTGEILDADIIFDASMIRFWKQDYHAWRMAGGSTTMEQPASLIEATRRGWGLANMRLAQVPGNPLAWDDRQSKDKDLDAETVRRSQLWAVRQGMCQCGSQMRYELGLGALAMSYRGDLKGGDKVPEELIGQAIKFVVMHEVGHTLGLRHNFKASTMLTSDKLNDTAITHKQGLVGSVMDYTPINLAPKGVKQGDYFSTTLGPYDYWAIEYAYKPLMGSTESELPELQKIAARCAAPGLDYATDEDMFETADPYTHVWDLGADPMRFAQDRMILAEELLKGLADRVTEKGEGYQRARQAFDLLLGQYGNSAYLVSSFVGAECLHRDHRGDPSGRDPFMPISGVKQREALKFVQDHILTDKPFQFSPSLLRKLAADRWSHWGNDSMGTVDFPIYDRILGIQKVVLRQVFDPAVMSRILNNTLKAEKDEQPLTLAELFRGVSDSIWNPAAGAEPANASTSLIRRNLQREHIRELSNLVLGNRNRHAMLIFFLGGSSASAPADARSLARMHLRELQQRLGKPPSDKLDDATRAHLEECYARISQVMTASMQLGND
jgi:hypothetical protein